MVDNLSQFPTTMVFSPRSQRVALGCEIRIKKNMTRENSYQPDTLFLIRLGKSSGVRTTNIEYV